MAPRRRYSYNDLGEKTSETWLDQSNNPVRVISWTYDDAGRMISASDPDSSYSFTYDLVGNVTGVDNLGTPNMPRVALNYTYDYAGNRTSLTDNLGGRIDYGYADHRLASMTWTANNTYVAQLDFAYDTVGRPTTVTRNGGANGPIVTAYQYDDGDRLTSITHTLDPQGTPTVLSQFTYEFDLANQITSYTGPEGTLNYSYDQTGQLIGVSGARTESYSFDENGNRTMAGYVTGDFNRLLSDGTYNYTYDLEGNMLTKTKISDGEKTTFTWDHRNRLTHILVTNAAEDIIKEAVYTYDVFDRRIGVWEDADGEGSGAATERWTVYDGSNPYADFDAQGSLTTQYLYGKAMDQLFGRYGAEGVDWYLTDNLGSVRQIVGGDGTVLDDIAYDSFGQVLNETNPQNGDRFKFTARELDALFGQYNYRARYYGPDIGRFTQEDPLSFGGGDTNVYRYVANSPVLYGDPSGELLPVGLVIGGLLVGFFFGRPSVAQAPGPGEPFFAEPALQPWQRDPRFGNPFTRPPEDMPAHGWALHLLEAGSRLPACGMLAGPSGPGPRTPVWDPAVRRWRNPVTGRFVSGPSMTVRVGNVELTLEGHALERMAERGVSLPQLQAVIGNVQPFRYFHDGMWKLGYYDPATRIFVGTVNNRVTTVITNVTPQYIQNLQASTP